MNPIQSTTTPYGLPWGNMPKNAHKSARELDNAAMNSQTMFLWQMRLYELAMSVFEWENLPAGINERQIEWWLLRDGFCVFLHDEDIALDPVQRSPEGYAIMQCMLEGNFDIYSQPVNRIAYSVMGVNIPLTVENSVIIWNSNLRVPTWFALNMYAKKLWAIDRAIDVNVYQQKTPRVVKCSQKQRLSFENMMAQVDEYKPLIMTDKDFDLESIDILDNSSPYVAEQLYELKDKYWKEALGFLGIASSESKSERVIVDEMLASLGGTEAQRLCRLESRQFACKQINEIFGLDVDVHFRVSEKRQEEQRAIADGEFGESKRAVENGIGVNGQ